MARQSNPAENRTVTRSDAVRAAVPCATDRHHRTSILGAAFVAAWGFLLAANLSSAQAPTRPESDSEIRRETATNEKEQLAALLEEELRLARRLVEAYPESEEPLVLMGSIHSRRGNTDQALAFWEQALQKNPRRADVHAKMANVAFDTDQFERAIELWRRALEFQPEAQGTHSAIAEALIHLGRYAEAIAEIRKEIEAFGDSPQNDFLLGQVCQHQRDYEKAKSSYERVVAVQPNHMKAVYNLYIVCARAKYSDEAKRYLALFKKLKARQTQAVRHADAGMMSDLECFYDALAGFCFDVQGFYPKTGNDATARKVREATVALGQDNPAFLRRLAGLYVNGNRIPEALSLYIQVAHLGPTDMSCQLNIGILSVRLQRFEQAESAFRKTILLAPDHYGGYQELARLYLRVKRNLREAKTLAEKAVELQPQADTYYDLGLACLANDDPAEALVALERAIELDPRNATYARIHQLIRKRESP